MELGSRALQKSSQLQRFDFDDQTYTIRRNLMIFSSISIAATFVSPLDTTGKYEVNMGIIKGVINEPILLYLFLAVTCLYHLVWFYIHCQKLVVRNYMEIKYRFVECLAQINAQEKFGAFNKELGSTFQGTPDFLSKGGNFERWKVSGTLSNHALRNHPEIVENLQLKTEFIVSKTADGISLDYYHNTTSNDLLYLHSHFDQYWRTRKEEWFITVLPITYSFVSIILISIHIYGLHES
ncbi:MAG: hypothetical protein ACJAS1_005053 [Oleiphilaceae bacterium]|jgi:hypothetical protein